MKGFRSQKMVALGIVWMVSSLMFFTESASASNSDNLFVSTITIATFNIRVFSDRSRNDAELRDIAQLVGGFDILALQETRDVLVLERLVRILKTDFGLDYTFSNSPPLGRGSSELYAFLWRTDRIEALSTLTIDTDPQDDFSREPAWQRFKVINPLPGKAPGFDFVLVDFHAIFGQQANLRRQEAQQLPLCLQRIEKKMASLPESSHEHDIMLLGDFNLSCQDEAFSGLRAAGLKPINPGLGTTIKDSPFDNIWYFPVFSSEYSGDWGMVKFDETEFDGNDQRASAAVSDHRPVWARFAAGPDDD